MSSDSKTQTWSQKTPGKELSQCLAISWKIGAYLLLLLWEAAPLLMDLQLIAGQSCWTARGSFLTAGQKGLCTSIVLARTSRKFFLNSLFDCLIIQHEICITSCLLDFSGWLWKEESCKNRSIQIFSFEFHEVLVLLTSPCILRYNFSMDFDVCNCR